MMLDEYYDALNREITRNAANHSTGRALWDCPPAVPLSRQRAIVDRARAIARERGLLLPRRYLIAWREGRRDICAGAARFDFNTREAAIVLSVCAAPADLGRTALHELQHLSDFHAGVLERIDAVERELRADDFANRCLPLLVRML